MLTSDRIRAIKRKLHVVVLCDSKDTSDLIQERFVSTLTISYLHMVHLY